MEGSTTYFSSKGKIRKDAIEMSYQRAYSHFKRLEESMLLKLLLLDLSYSFQSLKDILTSFSAEIPQSLIVVSSKDVIKKKDAHKVFIANFINLHSGDQQMFIDYSEFSYFRQDEIIFKTDHDKLNNYCQIRMIDRPLIITEKTGPDHSPLFFSYASFLGSTFESSGLTKKLSESSLVTSIVSHINSSPDFDREEFSHRFNVKIKKWLNKIGKIKKRLELINNDHSATVNRILLFMSGIEINPGPYDEEIEEEDLDFMESIKDLINKNINDDLGKNDWNMAELDSLLLLCENMASSEDFLEAFRKYPLIFEKLDLISDSDDGAMNHLVKIIRISMQAVENGWKVLILEGVDSKGVKFFEDLDLMISNEGVKYSIDVTNQPGGKFLFGSVRDVSGIKKDLIKSKNYKLESSMRKLGIESVNMVLDISLEKNYTIPLIPITTESNFNKEEFETVDMMIDEIRSLDYQVAKEMLENFMDKQTKRMESQEEFYEFYKPKYKISGKDDKYLKRNVQALSKNYGYLDVLRENEERFPDSTASLLKLIDLTNIKPKIKFPRFSHSENTQEDREEKMLRLLSNSDHKLSREIFKALTTKSDVLEIKKVVFKSKSEFNSSNLVTSNTVYRIKFLKRNSCMMDFKNSIPKINISQLEDLDEIMTGCNVRMMEKTQTTLFEEDVMGMIYSSLGETEVDQYSKEVMSMIMNKIRGTKLFDLIECNQMIYESMAENVKKSRMNVGVSSIFGDCVNVSITVSDSREFLVINNLTSTLKETKDSNVIVVGDIIKDDLEIIVPHLRRSTEMLFVSPDELNWGCLSMQKFLSIYTMIEGLSKLDKFHEYNPTYLYCLFCVNKMKFSNISELTRYGSINATGISNGSKNLLEKIFIDDKYKPSSVEEALYVLRLIKLCSCTEILNSNRYKLHLLDKCKSDNSLRSTDKRLIESSIWKIAMPYEENYMQTDDNIFNAIYFNKFLYHEHSNVLHREAKTMMTELAHIVKYRKLMLESKTRFCSGDETDGGRYLNDRNYHFFSIINNIIRTYKSKGLKPRDNISIGEMSDLCVIQDVYKSVVSKYTLNNVMNSRGSMSCTKTVSFRNVKMIDDGKVSFLRQNSKCWETSLINLSRFYTKTRMPILVSCEPEIKEEVTDKMLQSLQSVSQSLIPCLIQNQHDMSQYASRAVHKNGRGSGNSYREIHVMNSTMRFGCLFSELAARHIRDCSHRCNVRSNVMEMKTKDQIAENLYRKYWAMKNDKTLVFFDNADCSKWGPSMLSHILYLHTASRFKSRNMRNMLRNHFISLSNKVFKLTDNIIETFRDSRVPKAVHDFREALDESFFCEEGMYLINPQGMGQGLCGNGSGIIQDDCLSLSTSITERLFQKNEPQIEFVSTSDDYSQYYRFNKTDDEREANRLISATTFITTFVQAMMGIERNNRKSTKSAAWSEFNSVYRTANGTFNADIKIRNSFIDSFHDYDMSKMAISACENSKEALRKGLGFIGSCFIGIIGNLVCLKQSNMIYKFRSNPEKFYRIPLEMGGIIRVDPLRCLFGGKMYQMIENYTGISCSRLSKLKVEDRLRALELVSKTHVILEHFRSDELGFVEIDELQKQDERIKIKVPKFTRSGMITLTKRESRESRRVEELICKLDESTLKTSYRLSPYHSIFRSIMTIPSRLDETVSHSSTASRLVMPQVGVDTKIYKGNCPIMRDRFGKERFSRNELLKEIDIFFDKKIAFDETEIDYHGYVMKLESSDNLINPDVLISRIKSMENEIKNVSSLMIKGYKNHFTVCYCNRNLKRIKETVEYSTKRKMDTFLDNWSRENLPECFGGEAGIRLYDYLTAYESLKQSVKKICISDICMSVPSISGDESISEVVMGLRGNFCENGRLICEANRNRLSEAISYEGTGRAISYYDSKLKPDENSMSDIRSSDCMLSRNIDISFIVSDYKSNPARNNCVKSLFSIKNRRYYIERDFLPQSCNMYLDDAKSLYYESREEMGHSVSSRFAFKFKNGWNSDSVSYRNDRFVEVEKYSSDIDRRINIRELDEKYIEVKITKVGNFLCLSTSDFDSFFLTPLCKSGVCQLTKYKIVLSTVESPFTEEECESILDTVDDFIQIGRRCKKADDDLKELVEYEESASSSSHYESSSDDYDDIQSDYDDDYIEGEENPLDLKFSTFEELGINVDLPIEAEASSNDEHISDNSSRAMDDEDLSWIIANNSLIGFSRPKIRSANRREVNYELSLPFDLGCRAITSDKDSGKSLYKVICDKIMSQDSEDVDFRISMLKVCFRRFFLEK